MISRDTLFGVSVHFPIARLKLKHAAAIYTLQLAFRRGWTKYKQEMRAKAR